MKQVLITGASGFVGTYLANAFVAAGDHVVGIGTSPKHPTIPEGRRFKWISADTTLEGPWQNEMPRADIILNLAGRNIFKLWTKKYKQAIYDSRILTTKNVVDAINSNKPLLLTTSAVGIYGDRNDQELKENSPSGTGFLSQVCIDWENEALKAKEKGVRVCVMRFGVVLGRHGALEKMIPVFKSFVGGPLGSGRQWFPWVHIKDIQAIIQFLIVQKDMEGVFNVTAPHPVRQKNFAKSLGRALNRPAFIPVPAFVVKTIMGELGAAFLESQRAVPDLLSQSGYTFLFDNVDDALCNILEK